MQAKSLASGNKFCAAQALTGVRISAALIAVFGTLAMTSAAFAREQVSPRGCGITSDSVMSHAFLPKWEEESNWIGALENKAQIAVVSVVRTLVRQQAEEVLKTLERNHNLEAALGLLEQLAAVDALLAGVATKSPEQQSALVASADAQHEFAAKARSFRLSENATFAARDRELERWLGAIEATVGNETWSEIERYTSSIRQTASLLLAQMPMARVEQRKNGGFASSCG
jgi:hypothetical protein